jgi:hypothetical protein
MFLSQKGALLAKDHGEIFVLIKENTCMKRIAKDKY